MFASKTKATTSEYAPLALHSDEEDSITTDEKHSSSGYGHSPASALVITDTRTRSTLLKVIGCLSLALALLSATNIALLPAILSTYHAQACSNAGLTAAEPTPSDARYERSWPDRIARVSRKMKTAVWGQASQVYITVEDSTIMRFPIPSSGGRTCAISWKPPTESSVQVEDITTKGDVTEIEVWQLIAPSVSDPTGMNKLDYDTLSYSTLPVRGELLGVLDLTAKPYSMTVEFACPQENGGDTLTVEMRCQRVACHASFLQIDQAPRFGFELLRNRN